MNNYHTSVLLQETITFLNIQEGKKYIDATLGGGGHTFAIVEKGGEVLGIDTDQEAINYVRERIKKQELRSKELRVARGNFRDIGEIAKREGFESVAGMLFDLGVSSHQFDTTERGFSFLHDAPLDMRMDSNLQVTAADLVNGLTKDELSELFSKLGEEPFARIIANVIVRARRKKPIKTTGELADIVKYAVPRRKSTIHPATQVFQALRIAVNDELHSLEEALRQGADLLEDEGRLVVISFHSLEDRIVKNTFLSFAEKGLGMVLTEKPVVPSKEEFEKNRRSRSAKMRVFERKQ